MAKLTSEDVDHVAKLANLKITKQEIQKFRKQLSKVIAYVEELNEVDTSKVAPTHQTTGLENIKRKDNIHTGTVLDQKKALSGTEKTHNGYFVVPRVIGDEK